MVSAGQPGKSHCSSLLRKLDLIIFDLVRHAFQHIPALAQAIRYIKLQWASCPMLNLNEFAMKNIEGFSFNDIAWFQFWCFVATRRVSLWKTMATWNCGSTGGSIASMWTNGMAWGSFLSCGKFPQIAELKIWCGSVWTHAASCGYGYCSRFLNAVRSSQQRWWWELQLVPIWVHVRHRVGRSCGRHWLGWLLQARDGGGHWWRRSWHGLRPWTWLQVSVVSFPCCACCPWWLRGVLMLAGGLCRSLHWFWKRRRTFWRPGVSEILNVTENFYQVTSSSIISPKFQATSTPVHAIVPVCSS